jgi:hypothetical protein
MKVFRTTPEFIQDAYAYYGYTPESIKTKIEELLGESVDMRICMGWEDNAFLKPGEIDIEIDVDSNGTITLKEKREHGAG